MSIAVRLLAPSDAEAWQKLRRRSLQDHPEAFAVSPEEEETQTVADIAERFGKATADNCDFGSFDEQNALVGFVHMDRQRRAKLRHRAFVGGMYVAPEARGQGAGHALLKAAIDQARTLNGVVEVFLAVTVGNPAARHLYLSAGFVPYAVEPRFLYVQGNYYDIEWLSLRFDNP